MSKSLLLKTLAYYRTGGKAAVIYQPTSVEELQKAMREIKAKKMPYFLLGGGTNSLVMDNDWPGAVIAFSKMNYKSFDAKNRLILGAGVENSVAAKAALDKGLSGIAWMYRLPGQLGGTVRMNARCYGGEISEVVEEVVTVDENGAVRRYSDKGIFRGYKDTVFMDTNEAIAQVTIQLAPGVRQTIEEKMLFCEKDRESKGQFVHPTCGCVFKNDYAVGVPSGMLLERAGVKSFKHKGAEINPFHANFVYNVAADSRAILEMTLLMRDRVYDEFGVWLEYEMEILGKLPDDMVKRVEEVRPQQWKLEKLDPLREAFGKRPTS